MFEGWLSFDAADWAALASICSCLPGFVVDTSVAILGQVPRVKAQLSVGIQLNPVDNNLVPVLIEHWPLVGKSGFAAIGLLAGRPAVMTSKRLP